MLRPSQFRVTEEVVTAMVDAGFPPPAAAAAFRTIFAYVFGSALVETPPEGREQARRALASLPPDEFPTFTSMIDDAVATMAGDAQFELGLEALLDGLQSRLGAL